MAIAGDIVANLTANTSGWSSGFAQGKSALSDFQSFAKSSASGIVSSFGGFAALGGVVSALIASVGAVAGIKVGIGLAADAETAQVAFTTLLQSADAAQGVLSNLQQFAASTPFEFPELRDSAQKLLSFGVSTQDLMGTMQKLGDIAAGSGKPLGEIASIYGKVKATGKVSLETLNQLAERSIPIYKKLPEALGVGREEMLKMISTGKVGFADLDKALQMTVDTGGQFSGAMVAQSMTLNGMWSTFMDGTNMALQGIGQHIIDAFDFKSVLGNANEFLTWLVTKIDEVGPVIHGVAGVMMTGLESFLTFSSEVFSLFTASVGTTWSGFLETAVTALAMAEFGLANWETFAELAFKSVGLAIVTFGNDFAFVFTDTMPALFAWFSENWADVFFSAADLVATVFINIGQNIRDAMTAVWDFIASGGTTSLALAWTPLTQGFVSTLQALPNLPKREMSNLESELQADIDAMNATVSTGMDEHVARRLQALDQLDTPVNADVTITPIVPPDSGKQKKQILTEAITVRSDAGQRQLVDLLNRKGGADKALDEAKKQTAIAEQSLAAMEAVKQNTATSGLSSRPWGAG